MQRGTRREPTLAQARDTALGFSQKQKRIKQEGRKAKPNCPIPASLRRGLPPLPPNMPAGSCAVGAASRQARAQLLKLPSRRTVLTRNPAVPCQGAASSSSAVSRSFASSSTPSQEIPQWQKELQPEETPQWKKEWDSNETPQWQEDMETEETTHSHLGPLAVRDAYKYDALRPRPQSAFVALAHRLKLISHKTDAATQQRRLEALIQACTHVSFIELLARTREQYGEDAEVGFGKGVIRNTARGKFKRVVRDEKVYSQWQVDKTSVRDLQIRAKIDAQYMEATTITSNETLSALGNTLLGLIASEYLHLRYPNLPNRVLKAALSSYVGPNTLADVASEMGIAAKGIVRWDRPARRMEDVPANQRPMMARSMANKPAPDKLLSRDVHADVLRSIIAVMFQEQVSLAPLRSPLTL